MKKIKTTAEVKIDETTQEKKFFYLNRYVTYNEANEELNYIKTGYDELVKRWDGEMNQSRKIYIKNLEEKIKLLTNILENESSRS